MSGKVLSFVSHELPLLRDVAGSLFAVLGTRLPKLSALGHKPPPSPQQTEEPLVKVVADALNGDLIEILNCYPFGGKALDDRTP